MEGQKVESGKRIVEGGKWNAECVHYHEVNRLESWKSKDGIGIQKLGMDDGKRNGRDSESKVNARIQAIHFSVPFAAWPLCGTTVGSLPPADE